MKVTLSLLLFGLTFFNTIAQTAQLTNESDSVAYCIGILMGSSISSAGIDDINDEVFMKAVNDALAKKDPVISPEEANLFMNMFMGRQMEKMAQKNLEEGQAFLSAKAKEEGVVRLPSGLLYRIIQQGSGASPVDTSFVTVHYTGKLMDGSVFDSSVERGEPAQFPVNGVIPGWTEALKLMKPGAKWELYLPPDLAYGEKGNRSIAPNSVLIFDVELISVE